MSPEELRALAKAAEALVGPHLEAIRTITRPALLEVAMERMRQDEKWGEQNHPDDLTDAWWYGREHHAARTDAFEIPSAVRAKFLCKTDADRGHLSWPRILVEEVAEAVEVVHDPVKLRAELVQVAAVAVAWIEAIDRRKGGA